MNVPTYPEKTARVVVTMDHSKIEQARALRINLQALFRTCLDEALEQIQDQGLNDMGAILDRIDCGVREK